MATSKKKTKKPGTGKGAAKSRKPSGHRLQHPEDRNPYRFVWISILLLFAAVFLFISEISYFSCWKADASVVGEPLGSVAKEAVVNSCGHFGAKCADYLVRELFGIAAIIIPFTIILYALQIAHLKWIKVKGKVCQSVILLCFVSLFLGGFFGKGQVFFGSGLGGEMGIFIADWIKGYLGEEGTAALLIVLLVLILWTMFNKVAIWLARKMISGITATSALAIKLNQKRKEAKATYEPISESPVETATEEDLASDTPSDDTGYATGGVTGDITDDVIRDVHSAEESFAPITATSFEENDIEPQIETIPLDNGQLAALITDNYYLYLDIDALNQMEQDGRYVHTEQEEEKEEEEEIFIITRKSDTEEEEPTKFKFSVASEQSEMKSEETGSEQSETKSEETRSEQSEEKSEEARSEQSEMKSEENSSDLGEETGHSAQVDDMVISKADTEEKVSDRDVDERTLYDPTLELKSYRKPSIDLLRRIDDENVKVKDEEVIKNKNQIVETLATFGIKISEIEATVGPTITLYEIKPAPGVRISKIQNLEKDIALALAALGIRIIAPIPGKGTIGIEVPNRNKATVSMYSVIKSAKFHDSTAELPIALGKTIQNETLVLDLAKMPHLLVAGATGQGKSVGLNAIITSLLYKKHPAEIKFVMVDPKRLELTPYAALSKHFMAQMEGSDSIILTDTEKVVFTLNSICKEMDDRYKLLEDAGVKNLKEYNDKFIHRRLNPEKGHRFLPYLVVIVDEFADLIMTAGREIELPIARIAQLARAAGIHMIIATQRPTTNIITGTIKANFPARIAFRVMSYIDSKTILDRAGADQLIGRGDMLVLSGSDLIRVQCAFVDTPEVEAITQFIGNQHGYPEPYQLPEYQPDSDSKDSSSQSSGPMQADPLLVEVARYVVDNQIGSTSKIQRNFEIGFNRAGRIVDQLESLGIVGKQSGSKPRQVLITDPVYLEHILESIK